MCSAKSTGRISGICWIEVIRSFRVAPALAAKATRARTCAAARAAALQLVV